MWIVNKTNYQSDRHSSHPKHVTISMTRSSENNDVLLGSTENGVFLNQKSGYQLLEGFCSMDLVGVSARNASSFMNFTNFMYRALSKNNMSLPLSHSPDTFL
jgi:hypothetical protein